MEAQIRSLCRLLSETDSQLVEERQRREELQAQLLKVAENNRNLARHNTRLLQTADRLKTEGELVLHELHTRTAAFKACEAESARELGRLQRALDGCAEEMRELNTQLQAKQAALLALQQKLVQQQHNHRHPSPRPLQERHSTEDFSSMASGGWAASEQEQLELLHDSFMACADSADSAVQQRPARAGSCMFSDAADENQLFPAQDSFLVCADSANSTTKHCSAMRSTAMTTDLKDSADSGPAAGGQQHQAQDSFAAHADEPSGSDLSHSVQQEQRAPLFINLPKTVRLLVARSAGAISLPHGAAAGLEQPSMYTLTPQRLPGGGSPGFGGGEQTGDCGTESHGSNRPEEQGMQKLLTATARMAEKEKQLDGDVSSRSVDNACDRWSATGAPAVAPPAGLEEQSDGEEAEVETAQRRAGGSSELSAGTQGCETGSRSSGRTRSRVSYALPSLRAKLRQGDSFTFGDPTALPKKPRARTKPMPRFRQPAPTSELAIPASLQETEDADSRQ